MKQVAIFSVVALLFCACKPAAPTGDDATEDASKPSAATGQGESETGHRTDQGDVEQTVGVEAMLHPDSLNDSIKVESSEDALNRQRMMTIDVSAPFPEQLWLVYTIKCREDFEDRPVAFRFRVVAQTGRGEQRKERDLGSFAAVLGAKARKNTFQGKVDMLAGAEEVPETMLVKVYAEGHLMPDDTDETTVDPETATAELPQDSTRAFPYLVAVRVNLHAKEPAGE